jgi:hypothetical protein
MWEVTYQVQTRRVDSRLPNGPLWFDLGSAFTSKIDARTALTHERRQWSGEEHRVIKIKTKPLDW